MVALERTTPAYEATVLHEVLAKRHQRARSAWTITAEELGRWSDEHPPAVDIESAEALLKAMNAGYMSPEDVRRAMGLDL